ELIEGGWINLQASSWEDVPFTDESRYCIHNDSQRKRKSFLPQYIQPVVAFGGGDVKVWAGISLEWLTDLHIFDGTLNARRYEEEIIMEYVVPRANAIGRENLIFLDDNVRPHCARNVMLALNNNEKNLPPLSPDLNSIKHVWDMLQNRLNSHDPHSRTVRELRDILSGFWHEIPQEQIDNCIESMPNKCQVVIEEQGGSSRY
ncbi:DDE 3 domain containing protein, partial [Asbolus verrucosus]